MTGFERSRGLGTRLESILGTEGEVARKPSGGIHAVIPHSLDPSAEPVDTEPVDTKPLDTEPVDTEPFDSLAAPGGSGADSEPGGGDRRLRDDQVAFLSLEILQRALSLDLCAYISQRRGKGIQAQLRAQPALVADDSGSLDLAAALEEIFVSASFNGPVVVKGVHCLTIPSSGEGWRSLHVLGRRSGEIPPLDRAMAEQMCRIFAESLHGHR